MVNVRERWGLSLRGWIVAIIAVSVTVFFVFANVYSFLAINDPVDANVLVVEGWVHEYAIRAGAHEFLQGSYSRVYTTGGPVVGKGGYINDYNTAASVGADLLKRTEIPAELIQMVPSRVSGRDRTYSTAVALNDWWREHQLQVSAINIVTESLHARRTRLLFKKALGPEVAVGVIAVPNPDYDSKHWWHYSQAVEDVVSESFAYMYAVCFFHPEDAGAQ